MLSEEQQKEIDTRRLKTVNTFIRSNYSLSDKEIANILINSGIKTSSSTVGRDLTNDNIIELLRGICSNPEDVFNDIQEARKRNLMNAKVKGGNKFAQNNVSIKDENGMFIGSKKRV